MELWHLTGDTPRMPLRVSPGCPVRLVIGTWPIGAGQHVAVVVTRERGGEPAVTSQHRAAWVTNGDTNSYWEAVIGPFEDGDEVAYSVQGGTDSEWHVLPGVRFRVGAALHLALLWHHHQPLYVSDGGVAPVPWVRLHALRDYYGMASLLAEHPALRLTINFSPVLLEQLTDYASGDLTDRQLELTATPANRLTSAQRAEILGMFFDADWHHQIIRHPRYAELFAAQRAGRLASEQDFCDLQMWSNLAWFAEEFRAGKVRLVTGEIVDVARFVAQARSFTASDVATMLDEQRKILRAIVPLHRQLQDGGQIEVATSPYAHPILPLLMDTDRATIDRAGAECPPRFAHPEDATAQVRLASERYECAFGGPPRGMWPAEGAVGESVLPYFAAARLRWIASDAGVLARSGRWGYDVGDPNVRCQPYRPAAMPDGPVVFFRDAGLSDRIGFAYQAWADPEAAAADLIASILADVAGALPADGDRILTLALDGENAWGGYPEDGRPFLGALYRALEHTPAIRTVTFTEYLAGNPSRGVLPHPPATLPSVHDLFTGSWIGERGSAAGVDLGTWIGEPEENRAWELLTRARTDLARTEATAATNPVAYRALYAAEGSDWFWWFGDDQESGCDDLFDALFRRHLRQVYRASGQRSAGWLYRRIVPPMRVWTVVAPLATVNVGERMSVQTNCPGALAWATHTDNGHVVLTAAGGVVAGSRRFAATLGPFGPDALDLEFRFDCQHPGCTGGGQCQGGPYSVRILPSRSEVEAGSAAARVRDRAVP